MKNNFFLLLGLFICVNVHAQKKDSVYAFSYFKNNGQDGLHLAYSENGLTWKALKNDQSFLKPEISSDKLMRDPCVIRGADGLFHMVWTVSWTEKGIGYATSKDLIKWSNQQYIPVMEHEEKARNTWAPEITYDPINKEYMIYWATTVEGLFPETQIEEDNRYNHRMYYVTTKDFEYFTDAKLLYDPGFNAIDASIVRHDGRWAMFIKDETKVPVQKNIKIAFAETITGPYSDVSAPITGNYWAEGPSAINIDDEWIVYFDKYTNHQYGAVKSKDLINWEDISAQISMPKGIRHGTVFKISKKELKRLMKIK